MTPEVLPPLSLHAACTSSVMTGMLISGMTIIRASIPPVFGFPDNRLRFLDTVNPFAGMACDIFNGIQRDLYLPDISMFTDGFFILAASDSRQKKHDAQNKENQCRCKYSHPESYSPVSGKDFGKYGRK
jgi:hypothetical protein